MQVKKIREHLFAVLKHWVALMSGAASVGISVFERSRGITGVPSWIFLVVSAACFFIAFHRAWLDKDNELLEKEKELQASLGPAPEVVLEWQCSKRNPLVLHNLRGSTAYNVKIRDIAIKEDRLTAKFEKVSHIQEGARAGVLPVVTDKFVQPHTNDWNDIRDNFMYVLEVAYQTWGHDFDPVRMALFVDYEDRNGRRYGAVCNIEFDRFKETAIVTCEPPKPVAI
jgi:hypothetical protein